MCFVCCKELKGWCKSFTRIEGLLSILEAILLVIFISFFVFLILHFVACRTLSEDIKKETWPLTKEDSPTPLVLPTTDVTGDAIGTATAPGTATAIAAATAQHSTLPPDVDCTWEQSQPTNARTHYYLMDGSSTTPTTQPPPAYPLQFFEESLEPSREYEDVDLIEQSDGELAEDRYKSQIVALVKLKPPGDVTFGCILTKITKFWTLTAASCIESIEEVDSLDSFIVIENFGEAGASRPRTVVEVRLHPRWAGRARRHDLAALRSDRALRGRAPPLRLPRLLDYFLVALGERFYTLGYGGYRTVDKSAESRRLRQVSVFVVAGAACAAGEAAPLWAPRHLQPGAEAAHAPCAAAPLCAGALWARATPCNYCAGAPLLRGDTLYGVMSDNSACGVACEPQLYVNIATLRDWIDSVIE